MSVPETARNARICALYQEGWGVTELKQRYGISRTRLYEILRTGGVLRPRTQQATFPSASGMAVYTCIERVYSLEGRSPGIRQINEETGLSSPATVMHHLRNLERMGWIKREPRLQYAIVPIHYPRVYYRRKEQT